MESRSSHTRDAVQIASFATANVWTSFFNSNLLRSKFSIFMCHSFVPLQRLLWVKPGKLFENTATPFIRRNCKLTKLRKSSFHLGKAWQRKRRFSRKLEAWWEYLHSVQPLTRFHRQLVRLSLLPHLTALQLATLDSVVKVPSPLDYITKLIWEKCNLHLGLQSKMFWAIKFELKKFSADADSEQWRSTNMQENKTNLSSIVLTRNRSISNFYVIFLWEKCGCNVFETKNSFVQKIKIIFLV